MTRRAPLLNWLQYGVPGSGGFTRVLTFWTPKKPPQTMDTRCVHGYPAVLVSPPFS